MLAWKRYQSTIDERCQQPIERAWHPANDPIFFQTTPVVCHACTAKARTANPQADPVTHYVVRDTRDYDEHPLPPFRLEDFDDD
jgi:hypothetical protein